MGRHGHQQTAAMVVDSGWGVAWGGQSYSRNSSDPHWEGRDAGRGLPGGTLWVSFRLPSCTCQPCMYVCTFPTSLTSSHFLFPLHPLPYLTTHSSHPHTNFLTLTVDHSSHSSHRHWECVSSDGVRVGWQTKETAPSPHTLTLSHRAKLEWIWSVVYITIVHCCVCVCETSSVGLGKLLRNKLMGTSLDRNNLPGTICQQPHPTEDSGGIW